MDDNERKKYHKTPTEMNELLHIDLKAIKKVISRHKLDWSAVTIAVVITLDFVIRIRLLEKIEKIYHIWFG